jgi:cobyrinic acid a,c-diamide synthase
MSTPRLPAVDGLYIGGGFPEVFGAAITANSGLCRDIKHRADSGLPIYAECGGLMYLSRKIIWQDQQFAMCGILPFDVSVGGKPEGHGYTLMRSLPGNPFFPAGACVKGHEFHHSRVINAADGLPYTYEVLRGHGIDGRRDGVVYRNTFASYNHIHAVANPDWAPRFVALARTWQEESGSR